MADDNVLFLRDNGYKEANMDNKDVWDDTALIKAYDKAVNLAKKEVVKRMELERPNSPIKQKVLNYKLHQDASKPHKKWTVGAPCRAIYSEDGEMYEAIISKIYEYNGMCVVKFVGYDNTEKVELNTLLESNGLQSQIAQQKNAMTEQFNGENVKMNNTTVFANPNSRKYNGEKMDYETDESRIYQHRFMPGPSFNSAMDAMPPAPPLPPQLMAKLPDDDAEALSSMLMSWYISGFHTGYYHGLKQAKTNQEQEKKCC